MVAVFRICKPVGGKLKGSVDEKETKLKKSTWVDIEDFNFDRDLIKDEIPVIKRVIRYLR